MPSLIVRQAPKRGRVCLMLGASLLLHGGIVGIAALWLQPDPEPGTVIIDDIFDTPTSGPTPINPPATPEIFQTPDATTPTPPEIEPPIPTPPMSSEDLEMEEPVKPTPILRRPTVVRPVTATRATGPQTATQRSAAQLGSGVPIGANAGPSAAVGAWVTPHPPYPHVTSTFRPTGSTTVRITTDASGRVSNVVILKSAGNPILDSQTENFVRMNWHGPSNASRTTEFVYQIK